MIDEPLDVGALRVALGWTQQQIADYCGTDRSTVSKWEKDPPSKGPALKLLLLLRDRAQPERPAAGDHDNLSDGAAPHAAVAAGPDPQAGTGQSLQEAAE